MNWNIVLMNPMLVAFSFQMAAFQLLSNPSNYKSLNQEKKS